MIWLSCALAGPFRLLSRINATIRFLVWGTIGRLWSGVCWVLDRRTPGAVGQRSGISLAFG